MIIWYQTLLDFMIAKEIIKELRDEFQTDELITKIIVAFFEENNANFEPLIDSYVEEKLDEINKY